MKICSIACDDIFLYMVCRCLALLKTGDCVLLQEMILQWWTGVHISANNMLELLSIVAVSFIITVVIWFWYMMASDWCDVHHSISCRSDKSRQLKSVAADSNDGRESLKGSLTAPGPAISYSLSLTTTNQRCKLWTTDSMKIPILDSVTFSHLY